MGWSDLPELIRRAPELFSLADHHEELLALVDGEPATAPLPILPSSLRGHPCAHQPTQPAVSDSRRERVRLPARTRRGRRSRAR